MRKPTDTTTRLGAGFATLWAIAIIFHLLGAGDVWTLGDNADRIWGAVLGLVAIWVLLRPASSPRFLALIAVQLIDVFADAPILGSHWILGGLIALTLLTAFATVAMREKTLPGLDDLMRAASPTIRFEVIAFYAFAAFAKLNTGFFNPVVSCAVDFYSSVTPSWPSLHGPGIHQAVIWATVAIEGALPLLLLFRRSRLLGVWLGLGLHFVLALDPFQHVADFSSTMLALLVAFCAPQVLRSIQASGAWRISTPTKAVVFTAIAGVVLAIAGVDGFNATPMLVIGRQFLWWAYSISLLALFFLNRKAQHAEAEPSQRSSLLLIPAALLLLNGAAPYLSVKDGSAFNMYSNLNVGVEDSNHFLIPRALVGGTHRGTVVEIVRSSDPELASYGDRRLGLTLFELRAFASSRPEVSVTYVLQGTTHEVDRAGDDPVLSLAPTWLERKALLFRPIPLDETAGCVRAFGPAM